MGGRLDGILMDASTHIGVASPGGGFWNTTNLGTSWVEPTPGGANNNNYGMGDYTLLDLEYDQANGGVWAVGWNALYYSGAFGPTWTAVVNIGAAPGNPLPALASTGAPLHGTDPKPFTQMALNNYSMEWTLYSYGCHGLYYSSNGTTFAQSWPFSGGSTNPDNCISSIAGDELTGYVYILTMGMDGNPIHVYKSSSPWTTTTPSLTWVAANQGLPAGLPTGTSGAYLTWASGYANSLGLVTNDSSTSSASVWNYNDPPYGCANLWCLAGALPAYDARTAYYLDNDIYVGADQIEYSTDYGGSWSTPPGSMFHPDWRSFFFPVVYWGYTGPYMFASSDGATSSGTYVNIAYWYWPGPGSVLGSAGVIPVANNTSPTQGLPVWQDYFARPVPASNSSGVRLFVGAQDNGGVCSDDRGATWTDNGYNVSPPPANPCADFLTLVVAPSNHNRAYWRTCEGVLKRSDNVSSATSCSGVTWTQPSAFNIQYPLFPNASVIAVHPTNYNFVAVTRWYDVAISTDGGSTFTTSASLSPALVTSVYVDASGAIYAGTKGAGAFKSTNMGATWQNWGLNGTSAPTLVTDIAYTSAGGRTWFLATSSGLYRGSGNGSWTRTTASGSGYMVNKATVDPTCPSRVYAALGFGNPFINHRGGVLVSSDSGSTWTSITSGYDMHQGPVADVQVDPTTNRYLFLGSYGTGTWLYDYGAALSCP
jgi:hypothetical protein